MTLGTLADDIILRLTQSNPTDDSEIEKSQVMYLLAQNRDLLAKNYLDKQLAAAQPIDTQFITRHIADTVEIENEDEIAIDDERLYVELPVQPLTIVNDMGVVQVLTQEYLPVLRYRGEYMTRYQNLRFGKASSKNICFYRYDRKIIIKGLTRKNKDNDKFIVDYIPALASQTLTDSTDIKLSDALLPELTNMVEEIMKRQMYQSVQDLENDGVQEPNNKV